MIDIDLVEIKNDIEELNNKLNLAIRNYNKTGFENEHLYNRLESFQSDLESIMNLYSYFEREAKEGQLQLNERGRYELNGHDLTCGSPLELLNKDEYDKVECWKHGRIEHNQSGYYFVNYDGEDVQLESGMTARERR